MFSIQSGLVIVYILTQCVFFVHLKSIWFETCPSRGQSKTCEVHKVSMSPCDQHSDPEECSLTRGVNSTFRVEFVPFFSSEKLQKHIYKITYDGDGHEVEEDDTEHHDEEACDLTTCPIEAGKTYILEYHHHLEQYYSPGHFLVKWRIGNKKNDCCIKIKVEIR